MTDLPTSGELRESLRNEVERLRAELSDLKQDALLYATQSLRQSLQVVSMTAGGYTQAVVDEFALRFQAAMKGKP